MADPIITPAADAAIASVAGKTTFWAGITAGVTGWAANLGLPDWMRAIDWIGTAGLAVALIGLYVSWKFKKRQDARNAAKREEEHQEFLARMRQYEIEGQMRRELVGQAAQVDE